MLLQKREASEDCRRSAATATSLRGKRRDQVGAAHFHFQGTSCARTLKQPVCPVRHAKPRSRCAARITDPVQKRRSTVSYARRVKDIGDVTNQLRMLPRPYATTITPCDASGGRLAN